MRFLERLVLKQDVGQKITLNVITCSMLDSPCTSDCDDMDNCTSKSKLL